MSARWWKRSSPAVIPEQQQWSNHSQTKGPLLVPWDAEFYSVQPYLLGIGEDSKQETLPWNLVMGW